MNKDYLMKMLEVYNEHMKKGITKGENEGEYLTGYIDGHKATYESIIKIIDEAWDK